MKMNWKESVQSLLLSTALVLLLVAMGWLYAFNQQSEKRLEHQHQHQYQPQYLEQKPADLNSFVVLPVLRVQPDQLEQLQLKLKEKVATQQRIALQVPSQWATPFFAQDLLNRVQNSGLSPAQILFYSPHEGFVSELRKKLPEASFIGGDTLLSRLKWLSVWNLSGLASWGQLDALMVHPNMADIVDEQLVQTAHEKNKKIYVGPFQKSEARNVQSKINQYQSLGLDGVIVEEP